MEKFTRLTGVAAPLLTPNVDTDTIIPMARMVLAGPADMHAFAFEPLRFNADGSENPGFVLNREPFRDAPILLAGPNFGCGSSREGAVWALGGLGIRCIMASSFGGIFHANCFQSGVLPIVLPDAVIRRFAELSESGTYPDNALPEFTVDLETRVVVPPDGEPVAFDIDPARRTGLLEGLDDIGMTLKLEADIAAFQDRDRQARPWVYF